LFSIADRQKPIREPIASPEMGSFNSLIINSLDFTYPDSESQVLSGLSFELQPGKKIALVGPSGSGKSTLLRLIQHQLPAPPGKIYWNNIDAVDLSSLEIQSKQSFLSQHGYLFNATLRENLRLARRNADEHLLTDYIQKVGLGDLINNLPQGLDSWLGDNANRISGGERQRLLLARCLLMQRPVILVDEPFSNIDLPSEFELLQTIFSFSAGAAIIIATHRLIGMDYFDEILVMQSGRVIQHGKHETLVANPGLYQTLWNLQKNQFLFDQ
jgi:ABC-type transport system involved in cytochrome bd biosynthesis fused ATPase/permease subunit